jgi:predicted TIM-barrel fold metal-dependent hydrolase
MSVSMVGSAEEFEMTVPVAVTSADSHAGPRLEDQRPYCPKRLLDAFDEFAAGHEKAMARMLAGVIHASDDFPDAPEARIHAEQTARMRLTTGGYDPYARLRDMDRDGVAAEVIYHGTQDGNPIPFVGFAASLSLSPSERQLQYEGLTIYNRWLAEACSVAPQRLIGCVNLPVWDIEESVAVLGWARDAGLRAVSFPAPRRGIPFYDDPVWEPFWSACEDLGMVLSTHAGFIDREDVATPGRHEVLLRSVEAGGWPARRAIHRLIFGGVFERHPRLKLVLAEQMDDWWSTTVRELDSVYKSSGWMIRDYVPRRPSEYMNDHVFIGASFQAPFEAQAAVREGYVSNVMWGRDYPHIEGTWQYQETEEQENMTRLSMRYAYADIAPGDVRKMVSDNGIRIYDLDADRLAAVALEIGAPTLEELTSPIDALPEPGRGGLMAFRTMGPWG